MDKNNDNPQDNLAECKALIRNHPFFALFTPQDITQFAGLMKKITFKLGEIIVKENDVVDQIFLIASGDAEIQRTHSTFETTKILEMGTLSTGDTIGLSDTTFFSTTGFRTATIIAKSRVIIYGITFLDFYNFLRYAKRYPALRHAGEKIALSNFIVKSPLFSHLTHAKISELVAKIQKVSFPANTIIFTKNSYAENAYFLLSGKVSIFSANDHKIKELKQGDLFGKSDFLTQGLDNNWARAETDCELFLLTKQHFGIKKKTNNFISFLKNIFKARR